MCEYLQVSFVGFVAAIGLGRDVVERRLRFGSFSKFSEAPLETATDTAYSGVDGALLVINVATLLDELTQDTVDVQTSPCR